MEKKSIRITLNETAISEIEVLCDAILDRCRGNDKTAGVAAGIAEYSITKKYLTEKQAGWLCRNADYLQLKRPTLLADLDIAREGETVPQQPPPRGASIDAAELRRTIAFLTNVEAKLHQNAF